MKRILKRILSKFRINVKLVTKPITKPLEKQKTKIIDVDKFKLLANESHELDKYLEWEPGYGSNLGRLAMCISKSFGNSTFIDIGANIGDSIAILRSNGVENKILAIEGEKYYFDLLERNSWQFENIDFINQYLSDKEETLQLNPVAKGGTSRIQSLGKIETTFKKLDQIVTERNIQKIKLIKVDTDGYDFKILRGAKDTIKKDYPVIFCEYDNVFLRSVSENSLKNLEWIKSYGYNIIVYFDNLGRMLLSSKLDSSDQVRQLDNYIKNYKGRIKFYDVAIFHQKDDKLAEEFIERELAHNSSLN